MGKVDPNAPPPEHPDPYPLPSAASYPPPGATEQPYQQPAAESYPPPQFAEKPQPPSAYPPSAYPPPAAESYPPPQFAEKPHQGPAAYHPPGEYPPPQPGPYPPHQGGGFNQTPMVHGAAQVGTPMTSIHVVQPIHQVNSQGWTTQLFDCFDDPTNALITLCFPCVTLGQIAEIIDQGQTPCVTAGAIYGLIEAFTGLPCIYSCGFRSKLRAWMGLVEAPGPDWLVHLFCEPCALCQIYRELRNRGWDPEIGWQGNVSKQTVQVAMVAPGQQTMMA